MSIKGDSSNSPLLTFPLEFNTKGTKSGNKASLDVTLKKKTRSAMLQTIQHTTENSFNNIQSGLSLQ